MSSLTTASAANSNSEVPEFLTAVVFTTKLSSLNSSRRRFVPTPPPSLASPEHQNEQRIRPEQRAPESPLIKAASRGNDSYVLYENDTGILPPRKFLQAPKKIYVLSHKQRFVIALELKENVLATKLCGALRHSA